MISLMPRRSFRSAGIRIQSMPPSAAATSISGRRSGSGPILWMATKVAKIEPKIIWPSMPMFQKRTRKATTALSPTTRSGAVWTSTADTLIGDEKIDRMNSS